MPNLYDLLFNGVISVTNTELRGKKVEFTLSSEIQPHWSIFEKETIPYPPHRLMHAVETIDNFDE
jgi:hypothetical protein